MEISSELPPCKKRSAPTTICALGEDLLCEVFLRLPSLPSLVRAALTCPTFLRAVRSSPKFRRRFRELHPAPLLGIFLDIYEPAMPAFVPIRRPSDLDHAAAVRGADVFLTRVPDVEDNRVPGDEEEDDDDDDTDDDDDDSPGWSMTECRNGYVVLVSRTDDQSTKGVAVYDPLTRGLHLLPALPEEIYGDPEETEVEFHVDTPKEDRRQLRVVCVCKETRKVRVAVFSPDSREWQISPEAARLDLSYYGEGNGTVVNGSVYWASEAGIHVLNMATLTFSRMDPPPYMGEGSKIGETSDGKLCVAFATVLRLSIWVLRAATNGADKWMRETTFEVRQAICELELPFVDELDVLGLGVVAIINGTVYLTIFAPSLPSSSGWFLSFCIETEKLKKVCPITRSQSSYPYVMAWPPVLVGN